MSAVNEQGMTTLLRIIGEYYWYFPLGQTSPAAAATITTTNSLLINTFC